VDDQSNLSVSELFSDPVVKGHELCYNLWSLV